jgi:hypothetical protein
VNPNWDFWFENKPSGNPGDEAGFSLNPGAGLPDFSWHNMYTKTGENIPNWH